MGIHDQTRTSHPLPLSAPFPPQKLQLATSQCLAFWHFLRCLEEAWRVWRCPLEKRGVLRRIARSSTPSESSPVVSGSPLKASMMNSWRSPLLKHERRLEN